MAEELDDDLALVPDPVLRRVAEPITEFGPELETIVRAMFRRMVASHGVGLAGPQVGLRQRILVLNPTGEPDDDLTLVNPRITERSGPKVVLEEGCLSFPGIFAEVERPDACTVGAQDPQGAPFEATFTGFTSRIVQHEYDHLEGVLLVDRMSPADKLRNKAALEELVAGFRRARAKAGKG